MLALLFEPGIGILGDNMLFILSCTCEEQEAAASTFSDANPLDTSSNKNLQRLLPLPAHPEENQHLLHQKKET